MTDTARGLTSQALDVALALSITALATWLTLGFVGDGAVSGTPGVALGLVCVGLTLPLLWRRSRPTWCAAVIYATALIHVACGYPLLLPADLLVAVATYHAVAYGSRLTGRLAMVGAGFGTLAVGAGLTRTLDLGLGQALLVMTLIVLTFTVASVSGLLRRARLTRLTDLAERARRLESERDEQVHIATLAERTRIAREMHDIIAHSLSVLIAQADGGRYAARTDPEAAPRALETISEVGRASLADMRQLLGVLRDEALPHGTAETAPPPGVEALPELIAQVRAAGVDVAYIVMGTPRLLPPGTGLVVHRVAQEALTNVLKHAGPNPHTSVMVTWRPDRLTLEVSDDGRGASTASNTTGHGIIGMRERAAVVSGSLNVGPRPGGGHLVQLSVPLPPPSATTGESP
jgi:signal transduction histidine kinase